MGFNKNKFSIKELSMNENGKQSGSGFIGVYLGLIAGAAFVATMFGYFLKIPETINAMSNVIQLVFAASLLLGVRKAGAFIRKRGGDSVDSDDSSQDDSSEDQTQQSDNNPVQEDAPPSKPAIDEEAASKEQ